MSILSQLRDHKITFAEAAKEVEDWAANLVSKSPPAVHQAIGSLVADVKQAASDALSVGDTLAGPLINTAADAAGSAFSAAASAYLGPFGGVVTPAALDAIDRIRDGVKAELDTLALELKSQLATASPAAPAAH
jgi:hypothetical protein